MEADEYRKMAEVEDHMWYYRALHGHVTRSLAGLQNSGERPLKILDAGCGTGGLLRKLKSAFPSFIRTGLDFSPIACAFSRERAQCEIVQGSILSLPFSDGEFDAVISCDVVCQIAEEKRALVEFLRCLKPGGWLILTMPAYQWLYSYHDREVANLRRYSRDQLNTLLREAGFETVRSTYWNTLSFPLVVLKRKLLSFRRGASDVSAFPAPVETIFNGFTAIEREYLKRADLPFGTSVLTVARKPSDQSGSAAP